jgi:hypothetical protein
VPQVLPPVIAAVPRVVPIAGRSAFLISVGPSARMRPLPIPPKVLNAAFSTPISRGSKLGTPGVLPDQDGQSTRPTVSAQAPKTQRVWMPARLTASTRRRTRRITKP